MDNSEIIMERLTPERMVTLRTFTLQSTHSFHVDIVRYGRLRATINIKKKIALLADRYLRKESSCGSCTFSFCCYQPVPITKEEFKVIETMGAITDAAIEQAYKMQDIKSHADKRCPLLVNGKCSVYENRPSACMKYFVASPKERCDLEEKTQTVAIFYKEEIELLHAIMHRDVPSVNLHEFITGNYSQS